MPEQGIAYSPRENLGIDDAGYVAAHRLANFIYYVTTGVDVELMRMALVLRSSMDDADSIAAAMDGGDVLTLATKAALSIRPMPDEEAVIFHETEASKWCEAIARAARDEGWQQFDLHSLAPIRSLNDGAFVVEVAKVLDWLRRTAHPTLAGTVARELENEREPMEADTSGKRPVEKRRRAFTRAVFAALEIVAEKPGEKTCDAVFAYFAAGEDKTGAIVNTEPGYKIRWQAGKGEIKEADKDSLDTAIEEYRREKVSRRKV